MSTSGGEVRLALLADEPEPARVGATSTRLVDKRNKGFEAIARTQCNACDMHEVVDVGNDLAFVVR